MTLRLTIHFDQHIPLWVIGQFALALSFCMVACLVAMIAFRVWMMPYRVAASTSDHLPQIATLMPTNTPERKQ